MTTLLDTVATYLQNEDVGLEFCSEPENSLLRYSVSLEDPPYGAVGAGTLRFVLATIEDGDYKAVRIYSTLPVNIPEPRRPAVAELLARLNDLIITGNFEMEFVHGDVGFKTTLDLMDGTLTQPMLMHIFWENFQRSRNGLLSIKSVALGVMNPVTALRLLKVERRGGKDVYYST